VKDRIIDLEHLYNLYRALLAVFGLSSYIFPPAMMSLQLEKGGRGFVRS